jgi:V-type H+-transporting ATPase subunit H
VSRAELEAYVPKWDQSALQDLTSKKSLTLQDLDKSKLNLKANVDLIGMLLETLGKTDELTKARWIATLLYDMLREDAGSYSLYEEALKAKKDIYKPLLASISRKPVDDTCPGYIADRSAWILTAVVGSYPSYFSPDQVQNILKALEDTTSVSKTGFLSAAVNLLKASDFRSIAWSKDAVKEKVFAVDVQAPADELYKCVFAIWMLSYGAATTDDLKNYDIVAKIKAFLTTRVEKVARLCLTVIRSFLEGTPETRGLETRRKICEDMVEKGVLEAVQQLEYEKWRDPELYDEIKEVAGLLSAKVTEYSNFERYKTELDSGKLKWGFIHSQKFWAENVANFEKDNFSAFNSLAMLLLSSTDLTTQAVACHDVGEFVALHALGKKKAAELGVKERVMGLMAGESSAPEQREVRREALLCCQKIMLNKWQDVEAAK